MRHRGFTVVEMLVVIGIIVLLAALLFPAFAAARRKAREAQCITNLKEIATALSTYKQDHGVYPDNTASPMITLQTAGVLTAVRACPLDTSGTKDTYSKLYNYWGYQQDSKPKPCPNMATAQALYLSLSGGANVYWAANALDATNTGPTAQFPGLASQSPPKSTIVTICAEHVGQTGKYNVLRLDGTVEWVKPTDQDFWALSKK